ncbi:MAG: ABC transporter transmembrane domain-containing protein, partial [Trichlorobacter sp.]|nr:ABC transporter transmembrane domain-containing protein [Trichlorobacter sp.]
MPYNQVMQTAKTSNTFRQLAHLLPFINGLKNRYALGGLLLLITNIAALLTPWLMKKAVEQLENPINGQPGASQYALLIAALAFIHCLVRIFSRTTILNAARQVEYKIREALFANLMELDQTFFHKERTGDLISRFANDLTNIRMLCGFGSMSMLNTLILYFAAVWLMLM